MQAISQLCSRSILLNDGALLSDGPTSEVVNKYLGMTYGSADSDGDLSSQRLRLPISDPESFFKWTRISIFNSQQQQASKILFYEPFKVVFRGRARKACKKVLVGFGISSRMTGYIFTTHQAYNGLPDTLPEGISEFSVEIDPNMLAPGFYEIGIAAEGPGVGDWVPVAAELHIMDLSITPNRSWHHPYQGGMVDYPCKWKVESGDQFQNLHSRTE
jgi:hypothetical protein